ncbi:Pentraxin-related protein PTX3 [Buceros rhinoceros silvestris]|uniref:Pentraxin-related protein PTX3 n=1 Tax=Buceros rhinoceros silvestris TaxID=175836 RepID=A0A091HDV3_BUCRH|nr:PREDICTED: pentraxin-related protein PTX3 [Buceros rhinoceros silvestris]KFO85563.1 Pentraxin-related protein PTX3 [Buceros rhinoceros silvestris]
MLPQEILSLLTLFCVFRASLSVLDEGDDYDLMYVNLDNEIESPVLGTEETVACDCQREHTEWDKLFIMLENSQMKENVMLQAMDEVLKVDLQTLKAELSQLTTNLAATFAAAVEKVTSHIVSQVEQALVRISDRAEAAKRLHESEQGKVLENILLLSLNASIRLSRLESACLRRLEAEAQETALQQDKLSPTRGDNLILNSLWKELQQTRAELKASQQWAAQHVLPAGCETAILFPMRSKKIFGSVHPAAGMALHSFTACVWIKVTEALDKTIVFSYGTKFNPYEIQLYLSRETAVLVVGGDQHKLAAKNAVVPGRWVHLCGTWSSQNGSTSLWVKGELAASTADIADAHTVPDGGILQIGQEKNGCCVGGGFDETLAFSGKLTGFNMWDRVLSAEEIAAQGGEDACRIRGNVVGWGVTEVLPYGGAQYVS